MHVFIDYRLSRHGPHELTEAEQNAASGRLRASHISGLFRLLNLVDIRQDWDTLSNNEIDAISDNLRAVGQLGMCLADSLYGNVCELDDIVGNLSTFTEVTEEKL